MGGKVTVLRVRTHNGMLWVWTHFFEVLTVYKARQIPLSPWPVLSPTAL